MERIEFLGYNDYSINLAVWDKVENPKGIVQISHGMGEHIARYDDFAKFLNENGYIVVGDDHRCHGLTAKGKLGIIDFKGDCFKCTVQDLIKITQFVRNKYNLPVVLLGHSYGSFLAQKYIQNASSQLVGLILTGSARISGATACAGRTFSCLGKMFKKDTSPAKILEKLTIGAFDKKFPEDKKQPFSWLTRDESQWKKYIDDEMCGFVHSIAFYKSLFSNLCSIFKISSLNCINKYLPILISSGDKDPVGGDGVLVQKLYENYNDIAIKDVSIKLYSNARHEILNEENKQEVYEDMLEFANKCVDRL